MQMTVFKYTAQELFDIKQSTSLLGMPSWANLRFTIKRKNMKQDFGGLGLYGVFYENYLIYVGKFLGQKINPYGGDIRDARWSKHLGSLTLRARNLSFSKRSMDSIAQTNESIPKGCLMQVSPDMLLRDRGCLSTLNRFLFGSQNWSSFSILNDSILEKFEFMYIKVQDGSSTETDMRLSVSQAEVAVVMQLKPRCNAVILDHQAKKNLLADDFENATKCVLGFRDPLILKSTQISKLNSDIPMKNELLNEDLQSAEACFFEKLQSAPTSVQGIIAELIALYGDNPLVEFHYKMPKTPQLRVRDLQPIAGSKSQNILTLEWQKRKSCFKIRALTDIATCEKYGGFDVKLTHAKEPLTCEFNFPENGSASNLSSIINKSISQRRL